MSTRGRRRADWTLIAPDNHYPSRLPELPGTRTVKLVTPRLAPARFAEILIAFPADPAPSGKLGAGRASFLYVLQGSVTVSDEEGRHPLTNGAFAYRPGPTAFRLTDPGPGTRLLWVSRPRAPHPALAAPPALAGHRDDEPFEPTELPGFRRRELLPPDDPRHDFHMSLLAFDPGVGLPNVEIHDEEHGLYLLAGEGVYRLGEEELEVRAGDFIYMAPYCPQGFRAGGDAPAEYLLYKDVWRDAFA